MIKASLIISLLAYIMFWLTIYRMVEIYKKKFEVKKNKSIGLYNHIRIILIILIPILNLFCLIAWSYSFLFKDDEVLLSDIKKKEE